MHLHIYGINYFPELIGIGKYTTEMSGYLAEKGHNVTVTTAFPYYPEWKIPKQYKNKVFLRETFNGIDVRRTYLYVPSQVTKRNRIVHELSFILSSFLGLFFVKKAEVLIVVSPPLGLGLGAYLFCKIKKIPFVFLIQDLQPDAAVNLGMIKSGFLIKLLYKIEKFIYKKASLICTVSEGMKRKILTKNINQKKIFLLPNWVDADIISPKKRNNIFRDKYNLNDKFVVLYSGNIGIKQGLDIILDVAEKTKHLNDLLYLIVGDGVYRKDLFEKYKKMNLKNLKFLPLQPKEMLPYMFSASDVSLVLQKKDMTDIVMPSKLLDIMGSGKPVIVTATQGSGLFNTVKINECGIVIEPGNPEELLKAIMYFYKNKNILEEFGKRGKEYVLKNFSMNSILERFERVILEVI